MKYYVKSAELEKIVLANSPLDACVKALGLTNGEVIDKCFYVDERGFRGITNSVTTDDLLPAHIVPYNEVVQTIGGDEEIK